MNRSITHQGFLGLGLALCSVVSGCAVLTVDVDVYKGSLVNEEHVQLHQLVALATAAQPMLAHLRDNLEWPETEGKPPEGAITCSDKSKEEGNKKNWYEKGYVRVPDGWVPEAPKPWWKAFAGKIKEWFLGPPCQPHFRNAYARAVNSVLSLYDDRADPDLSPHGRKLRAAVDKLKRAGPDAKEDQAIYDKIASGFKADKDLGPNLASLKQGYRELLISTSIDQSSRKVGTLMDALKALAREGQKEREGKKVVTPIGLEADLLAEWKVREDYKKKEEIYDRRLPFRAVWKFLGEGTIDTFLAQVTRQLCLDGRQDNNACSALLERTKELADEYWDSRKAVREIWQESLSLLLHIERLQRDTPGPHPLMEKVIRLIVTVTDVRHIASALDRLDDDGRCSILRGVLARGAMCEVGLDGKLVWNESNVKNNIEYFEINLRRALSVAPADTVHFLLYLDSLEKTSPQKHGIANDLVEKANKVNAQRVVRLGLNRSFIEDRKLEDSPEVFGVVDDVSRNLAQGFERGRLPEGLDTLTEAFLKSHDGNRGGGDSHDERRLLDALVEFAQKLLFLANHEGLASPPGTPGLILGGAEKFTRGLFGDDFTDTSIYTLFSSNLAEAKKQQYVRVLQAVGNSILFSANELRERDRYRDLSEKRVPAEVAAVKAVYSLDDPLKILNDLLNELRHDQDAAKKQLDETTTKKAAIDARIGSAANPKTGLWDDEETALKELNKAKQDLDGLSQLKAIHDVVTPTVTEQIKTRWRAEATGDATDLADFLTGPAGIDKQLTTIRQAQDGVPTAEEIHLFNEAIKYVTSAEAKTAFTAYRTLNGQTSLKRVDLLEAFTAHLRDLETQRAVRATGLEKARDEKERKHRDIQNEIKQLEEESLQLAKLIAQLPNTKAQLATAETVIGAMKMDVVKEAEQHDRFISPQAMYLLLATYVERKAAAETDAVKRKAYEDTQKVLSKRTPPPGLPPLNAGDYKSPVEVMDTVIALLRHREMLAVERYGQGSAEGKLAAEAVEHAYQHRAGMIYIRPSSAYLRTSFPSTSLQDDPNLAWDNMLLTQGIRNLPFSSQLRDILDPSVKRDQTLTTELDKQYWQNINRVRVSGVGRTNQALVKDDVGNWYVKQYYGDTKDIIKSAKNLALFNLGTKLPIDLAGELKAASKLKGDTKTEAAGESPPLNRVLEKHRNVYQAKTTEASTKLEELHAKNGKNTVHDQIVKGWENVEEMKSDTDSMDALKAALDVEIREWDKAAEALKSKPDQDRGQLIVKDIRALSKFEKLLSVKIQEIDKEAESKPQKKRKGLGKILDEKIVDLAATPDNNNKKKAVDEAQKAIADEIKRLSTLKTKAMTEVGRVVGPLVLDMLKDRKRALDSYEQAIMFIGDAANSNSSP